MPNAITADDLYAWFKPMIGTRDNRGAFIWKLYAPIDYTGSAYCGATQAAAAKALGTNDAPTTHARHIYVPYVVADAKAAGKWAQHPKAGTGQKGDEVIFDWNGNGSGDHITRLIEDRADKPYVVVWGGNHGDGITNGARGAFVRTFDRKYVLGYVQHPELRPAPVASKPTPTRPTPTPAPTKVRPVLRVGSTGAAVRVVQAGLLSHFPAYAGPIRSSGGADGSYGPATERVVRDFQRRCGLTPDGITGPITWAALGRFGIKP